MLCRSARPFVGICIVLAAGVMSSTRGEAQGLAPAAPGTPQPITGSDGRPTPTILASDADFSALGVVDERSDWSDRLKAITIAGTPLLISLAGVGYVEGEAFDNENFGARPDFNAFWNTRLNLYASVGIGDAVRIFGALKHGERRDYGGFVPPVERDTLDLHQAFIEVRLGTIFGRDADDVLLRAGRQELHYGAGRMISIRQGPNVRQDFDGGLARARLGRTIVDGFAMYDVVDQSGVFDNDTSKTDGVWGLYGSTVFGGGRALDLYYIGERRRTSAYVQGNYRETRHSIGARWSIAPGERSPWSGDVEATAQFGDATDLSGRHINVRAWSISGQVSYAWPELAWAPTVTATAGISSGDGDSADATIGTFRAPNPPGRYFGETTPFGPGNLFGGSIGLTVTPATGWTIEPDLNFFWRLERNDGTYTPNGMFVRGAAGPHRFAGWEVGALTRYRINRHFSLHGEAGYFMVGPYLRDNRPAENVARFVPGVYFSF